MTRVFADTYYFIALANPRDQGHQSAVEFTAAFNGSMVTTSWVLTEFANEMSDPRNRPKFLAILDELRSNGEATIVPADQEIFDEGVKLFGDRLDKEWSLTDCISFIVMTREQIVDALTGDHHFEQAGFRALLK